MDDQTMNDQTIDPADARLVREENGGAADGPKPELTLQLTEARSQNEQLRSELEAMAVERDKAAARIAELEKQLAAKSKGKVTEKPAPKVRKAGPLGEGKAMIGEKLREAVRDGDEVEVVFSDGKKEIDGIAARAIDGDVWRDHALGWMLRDPVVVTGATVPVQLVGYALFIDGRQVAWTERTDPVNLAPGQSVSLENDIYFA